MNCNKKWHQHFGVYGVCQNNEGKLLVIKKKGGPYTGRYDLPGGSFKTDECLVDALKREMLEETGCSITIDDNLGCYDFLVNAPYNGCIYTHHIAQMYSISIKKENLNSIERCICYADYEEENDSTECAWISLDIVSVQNSSPLLIKVCEILGKRERTFALEEYLDWKSQ